MAKTFEVTCPHCNNTYEVEVPSGKRRGQLFGLTLEEMTDDQLKREIINAGSVLYKAKQRGAAQEIIDRNQARLDAAKAEKAKRMPAVEEAAAADVENDGVYDEETATEV